MTTRTLVLTVAALALLPFCAAIADDISGDYGHHTVGSDTNDDAGNIEHDDHPREAFDNDDAAGGDDRPARRVAEDGRYTINRGNDDTRSSHFNGND